MLECLSSTKISEILTRSLDVSRNELQLHKLFPGTIVHHPMFDVDLCVVNHKDAYVRVSYVHPDTQKTEEALLPQNELYYPDLAAGILILELSRQ